MSTNDLLTLLEERAAAGAGPVLARTRGSIVFDAGADGAWTILLDRGNVRVQHGPVDEPMSTISASLPVLKQVIEGTRSGLEAFLSGELTMRGSMALALQMDGLFAAEERPAQVRRAGLTLAAGIRTAYLGRWLSAFFDAVGADKPVLIGNSLGGRTALEAGLEYPDKVGGLVLLCPAVAFRKIRQFVPLVRKLNPRWASVPVPMTR